MGMTHKKSRTTGKRPRRTGEKAAQNTGTDFLALGLRVVLSLPRKAFSPKKGLVFAVNGAWAPPPSPGPPTPPPLPPFLLALGGGGGFTENARGGRGSSRREGGGGVARVCTGNLEKGRGGGGGAEAPFTAKTSPFFGENALH